MDGHRLYNEESISDFGIIRSPLLSPWCIWTDGAVKFNFEINEELTKVFRLNDEQISNIIQRDYTREDGRHVYNHSGIKVFLNRDEQYEIIKRLTMPFEPFSDTQLMLIKRKSCKLITSKKFIKIDRIKKVKQQSL